MHFFISACAIHNCSHSINQFVLYPTSPSLKPPSTRDVGQFPTKAEVLVENLAWLSSQELQLAFLLQHQRLANHAAFQQQCPEGYESIAGGTPLFSQTPLDRGWRIPEVGLRAHPFNLSVLMGFWRVGRAQLGCSGVEVAFCSPALCTTLVRQQLVSVCQRAVTWRWHWGTWEGAAGLKAEKTRPVVDSCLSLTVEFSKGNGESCAHNEAILGKYLLCLHSPVPQSDPYKHTAIPPLFWAAWHLPYLLPRCSCLFSSYCNYGTFRWKISSTSLMFCFWWLSSNWAMEWNGSGAQKKPQTWFFY